MLRTIGVDVQSDIVVHIVLPLVLGRLLLGGMPRTLLSTIADGLDLIVVLDCPEVLPCTCGGVRSQIDPLPSFVVVHLGTLPLSRPEHRPNGLEILAVDQSSPLRVAGGRGGPHKRPAWKCVLIRAWHAIVGVVPGVVPEGSPNLKSGVGLVGLGVRVEQIGTLTDLSFPRRPRRTRA